MRTIELLAGARALSGNPHLGDFVTVRSGESGPVTEPQDTSEFVMNILALSVESNRISLEQAQSQLDGFFPGSALSLAETVARLRRD